MGVVKLSNIIKALRKLRDYNQDYVAEYLGLSPRTYNVKENNPDTFTVSEIKKLSKLFNVEESIFFKDELTLTVS